MGMCSRQERIQKDIDIVVQKCKAEKDCLFAGELLSRVLSSPPPHLLSDVFPSPPQPESSIGWWAALLWTPSNNGGEWLIFFYLSLSNKYASPILSAHTHSLSPSHTRHVLDTPASTPSGVGVAAGATEVVGNHLALESTSPQRSPL